MPDFDSFAAAIGHSNAPLLTREPCSEIAEEYPELTNVPFQQISCANTRVAVATTDLSKAVMDAKDLRQAFSDLGIRDVSRELNGFPTCAKGADVEFRDIELKLFETMMKYDEAYRKFFCDDACEGLSFNSYRDTIIKNSLEEILRGIAHSFWFGTQIQLAGFKGIYGSDHFLNSFFPRTGPTAFVNPNVNTNNVGQPGKHTSVWLLSLDPNTCRGISFVGDADLEIGDEVFVNTFPEAGSEKCARLDLARKIKIWKGLANTSQGHAARIFGVGLDPTATNVLTKTLIRKTINALSNRSISKNWTIWMNPATWSAFIEHESTLNTGCCDDGFGNRTIDGFRVIESNLIPINEA